MLNSGLRYQITLKVLCPNPLTSNFGCPFLHINIHTTRISSEHLSSILSVILNQSFTLGFCAVNIKGRKTSFLMRTTLKLNTHFALMPSSISLLCIFISIFSFSVERDEQLSHCSQLHQCSLSRHL